MIALMIFLELTVSRCLSMDEAEFHARAEALKATQNNTEVLMNKLRGGHSFIGLSRGAGSTESENEKKPLFQIHGDFSDNKISSGKLLYGKLLNRLVVGGESAPVLVILDSDQNVFSGLRFLGVARQSGTQGRINLELNKLILRSGRVVSAQATALDPQGAYGLEAQIFSGKALAMAGAIASSFVAGLASSQQTQNTNAFGFMTQQPTGRNGILQGIAQTAADQSKRLIDESTAEKPVLILESLASVTILIQEEVRF
ncbi:MAG: TrbI/VirB10 family protein [Bdellovibrionota bacterium]